MAILGTYSDPSILGHSALTTRVTITQPSSLLTQQSPRSKTKQHGWANFNYPLPPSLFLAQPVWKAPAWPPSQYIFNRNSYQWVFFCKGFWNFLEKDGWTVNGLHNPKTFLFQVVKLVNHKSRWWAADWRETGVYSLRCGKHVSCFANNPLLDFICWRTSSNSVLPIL